MSIQAKLSAGRSEYGPKLVLPLIVTAGHFAKRAEITTLKSCNCTL